MSNYIKLEIRFDDVDQNKFRLWGLHNNGSSSYLHTFQSGTFPITIEEDSNGDNILSLGPSETPSGNFHLLGDENNNSYIAFTEDFLGIPSTGVIGIVDTRPAIGKDLRRIKLDGDNTALFQFTDGTAGWTCEVQYSGSTTSDLSAFFNGDDQAWVKDISGS